MVPFWRAICAALFTLLLISCDDWGQYHKPHLYYAADFPPSRIGEAEALVRKIAGRRSLYLFEKEHLPASSRSDVPKSFHMFLFHDEGAFERKRWLMSIGNLHTQLSIFVEGTDVHGRPIAEVDSLAAEVRAGFESGLGLEFCPMDPIKGVCPPKVGPRLLYRSDFDTGMAKDAEALLRNMADNHGLYLHRMWAERIERATGRPGGFELHLRDPAGRSGAQDVLALVSAGAGAGVTLAVYDLGDMPLWELDSLAREAKSELQRSLGLAFCRADPETGACDTRHAALETQREAWLGVRESNAPADMEAFLAKRPDSPYAEMAHRRLARLRVPMPTAEFAWEPLRCGTKFRDPLVDGGWGPEMATVPTGGFRMGCGAGVDCRNAEQPVREVQLARPFAFSVREVTFTEYLRFAKPDAQAEQAWADRPAVHLSWDEAAAYAEWLSAQTGRRYRLPSEAEWEYAARAGSGTAYAWGDEVGEGRAHCWRCAGPSDPLWTTSVGLFAANTLGLHDMHGNAAEWTADCWSEDHLDNPADGTASMSGDCRRRVVRGGSYSQPPQALRSAARVGRRANRRHIDVGFRVVRDLSPEEPPADLACQDTDGP